MADSYVYTLVHFVTFAAVWYFFFRPNMPWPEGTDYLEGGSDYRRTCRRAYVIALVTAIVAVVTSISTLSNIPVSLSMLANAIVVIGVDCLIFAFFYVNYRGGKHQEK